MKLFIILSCTMSVLAMPGRNQGPAAESMPEVEGEPDGPRMVEALNIPDGPKFELLRDLVGQRAKPISPEDVAWLLRPFGDDDLDLAFAVTGKIVEDCTRAGNEFENVLRGAKNVKSMKELIGKLEEFKDDITDLAKPRDLLEWSEANLIKAILGGTNLSPSRLSEMRLANENEPGIFREMMENMENMPVAEMSMPEDMPEMERSITFGQVGKILSKVKRFGVMMEMMGKFAGMKLQEKMGERRDMSSDGPREQQRGERFQCYREIFEGVKKGMKVGKMVDLLQEATGALKYNAELIHKALDASQCEEMPRNLIILGMWNHVELGAQIFNQDMFVFALHCAMKSAMGDEKRAIEMADEALAKMDHFSAKMNW